MIGCIGYGFVGSALTNTFSNTTHVAVYDIYDVSSKLNKNCSFFNNIYEFINILEKNEDLPNIFICVPTPMYYEEKKCDTRIIDSVLELLFKTISKETNVIIKSTIPIGQTDLYNNKYSSKFNVIFNPEFLTQNNAEDDFKKQNRTILGLPKKKEIDINYIVSLYKNTIHNIDIHICEAKEAEITKLMLNSFWATKVSFANEMYDICKISNIDYENVQNLVLGDERIGKTHLSVPGFDGLRGFGGVCLPKDLNNLKTYANELGLKTFILDSVWEKNCKVREDFDWEKLVGKAISKK